MAITIKDVAREAGVSISTVSKVINQWPTISEKTVNHVHQVMRKLDYTPNSRASNFARQATNEVGFLAPLYKGQAFNIPHMFETICGITQVFAKNGYRLSLVDSSSYEQPCDAAKSIVSSKAFDGIIVHGSATTPEIAKLVVQKDFPHILIGCPDFDTKLCWVDTNHVLSGDVAARHLVETGCRKIVFIAGSREGRLSRDRIQGFLSVMREYEIKIGDDFVQYTGGDNERSYEIVNMMLAKTKRPDAIICESNQIAIRALKALREQKVSLPDDMSLITFDDYPLSHIMDPMPTVVDIDMFDLGLQAGNALLQKIRNTALQIQSYTTLPTLIQRSTTKG